ncbi:multicopper oxidase family protein [Nocardioides speluncae]|uniref:multicopper oxidase family protein n=1 Tax=Nocardioides speluncae TaxID=2670337 RepID=UPI000D68AE69|nr:multicopper oxidase domain-containing protein [Nocardioides speluncae]
MGAGSWLLLDHLAALLTIGTWFGAGVTAVLRRPRWALGLLAAALLSTLARVGTVAVLAGHGWWFVQEKVLLGLPLLMVTGAAALVLAGPPLLTARRTGRAALPRRGAVAPLVAGYAALAGFLVTFVVGYPLTWSTALVSMSVLGFAALLTARAVPAAVATDPLPAADRAGLTRRGFLGASGGVAVGSALTVTAGGSGVGLWLMSFLSDSSVTTGGGPGRAISPNAAVPVTELRGERSPAPGGVVRRHTVTARQATVRLPSGREVEAFTYDGRLPGTAITATEGDLVDVTLRNEDIEDGVTLHWHGYDVACGEDGAPGVTQPVVLPGEEFRYRFRADQVGTYWYHTHQASHIGVRKGLYGTLVVTPRGPRPDGVDLTLPVHTFDGTVLLGDSEGRLDHTAPAGTPVRMRLVNTDSEPHIFALDGTAFRVAAVDGRDLHQPGPVEEVALRLPAGGRYDLVFDQPDGPVALLMDDDVADWPELDLLSYGRPAAVPFDAADLERADREFTIVLDRGVAIVDGRPAYAHTVNGRGHPRIPDQLVAEGDLVRFTVVNRSLDTHPWHLHGHPVLVMSRNGDRPTGSPLWLDTFDVRPGDVWEVGFRADNPGIWMNHCHNLPHAHQGMMLRLVYDGVTDSFHGAHTGHH